MKVLTILMKIQKTNKIFQFNRIQYRLWNVIIYFT